MKKPDHSRGFGRLPLALLCTVWLAGCAAPSPRAASQAVSTGVPAQWQAPVPGQAQGTARALPHNGSLADLSLWWQQQNDSLLVELIMAAESVSPSIASARSNIEQARASRVAAGAALVPRLDGTASVTRSKSAPVSGAPSLVFTTAQAGLQASWEIDVFGGKSADRNASQQRLEGIQALWHSARVSVAAEVATQYYSLRACAKLVGITQSDAASRAETSRLTELSAKAGFQAPATAALARASAAEGLGNAIAQRALCDLDIKALVALTGLAEPDLRQKLARPAADIAEAPVDPVVSVPAQVLAQRPDVFNAAREVDAAQADLGSARAQRYPSLSLNGSIATAKIISPGGSPRFDTWSVGPLQLTLPLFDGGVTAANVDAAQARYDNAALQYRGSVRQAVREVEEAMVKLQSTAERSDHASTAAEGYRASFTGTQARYQSGLASLVELEDARRTLLSSQSAVVNLQRDRRSAWVALYRALGGGWTAANPAPPAAAAPLAAAP